MDLKYEKLLIWQKAKEIYLDIQKKIKTEKNENQMKWYLKLLSKGILTQDQDLKEMIIRGLYNLEYEL